jgi:ribosome-associated translation inhibitor RaiA
MRIITMQIQLNSGNHITGSPALQQSVEAILEQELKHLTDELTRIEVHLNDENAAKGGDNDKRCMLEARVTGLQPVTVEHKAETMDLAVRGAAAQLTRALKNTLDKKRDRRVEPAKRMEPPPMGEV